MPNMRHLRKPTKKCRTGCHQPELHINCSMCTAGQGCERTLEGGLDLPALLDMHRPVLHGQAAVRAYCCRAVHAPGTETEAALDALTQGPCRCLNLTSPATHMLQLVLSWVRDGHPRMRADKVEVDDASAGKQQLRRPQVCMMQRGVPSAARPQHQLGQHSGLT